MNEKTNKFTDSCSNKFRELANLFKEKNKQYGDKDPLANFRNGAMLQYGDDSREHMYETAKSYCLKHVAHVFGAGQTINEEKISESLGDIAVYCIIMQYMVDNKQATETVKPKENGNEY
ncbi:MAG TPA: hypothetical protein DCQ00_06985 [Phascolarctobacterium succinatutens]|uniref:hypothetical protein n=1 Tax=Phascolarctobacterium succinatutens TaxID=626940 RepID=UPI000EEEA2B4|nr:hypothetical protein [Phascolarctobacterium succinatutens]HAM93227.1 hypothetical protein [Phascolarctobacterium succinatutens]